MQYVKFIGKRILIMMITLFVVSFLLFLLLRISGTDPVSVLLGEKKLTTDETVEELRKQYNLDKPILEQYGIWLKGVTQGDFGKDYIKKQPVTELIGNRVSITAGLVIMSIIISVILAIPLGIICALKNNKWQDHLFSTIMLIITAAPGFLVAMIFLVILCKFLPGYSVLGAYETIGEYIERLFVPSFCLALTNVALIGRITRSMMIKQMQSDYMLAVESKGLSRITVIFKHAFHNSIIPIFTVTAMVAGTVVGNSVLVEQVFSLPGLGSLLTEAVLACNYPLVLAIVLILVVLFQTISLISDILYTVIDPRIRI